MRKITEQAIDAFLNYRRFKKGNTEVTSLGSMFLFGNQIAWHDAKGRRWISNCGYKTVTTKERLNGLPHVNIIQKQGTWFLNGQRWDGTPICVDNF